MPSLTAFRSVQFEYGNAQHAVLHIGSIDTELQLLFGTRCMRPMGRLSSQVMQESHAFQYLMPTKSYLMTLSHRANIHIRFVFFFNCLCNFLSLQTCHTWHNRFWRRTRRAGDIIDDDHAHSRCWFGEVTRTMTFIIFLWSEPGIMGRHGLNIWSDWKFDKSMIVVIRWSALVASGIDINAHTSSFLGMMLFFFSFSDWLSRPWHDQIFFVNKKH